MIFFPLLVGLMLKKEEIKRVMSLCFRHLHLYLKVLVVLSNKWLQKSKSKLLKEGHKHPRAHIGVIPRNLDIGQGESKVDEVKEAQPKKIK